MIAEKIIVRSGALGAIRREMKKVMFVETGGVLVGQFRERTLFVTAASGPGPRSVKRPHYVMIDGVHASQFCLHQFEASGKRVDYVGDWHCHLSCTIRHSVLDVRAMRTIAEWDSSPTINPISLILSKWRRSVFSGFVYLEGQLLKVPVELQGEH
jgi:integrative and conjugative element protein (TIGR02256 family)